MAKTPLIGLPGRQMKSRNLQDVPAPLRDLDVDVYFADYARAVLDAGGMPVHIPLGIDATELVPRLDGILLTGGTDIEPARYGAEPHTDLLVPEPARDDLEFSLLDAAIEQGHAVLGICRGLQLINVFNGGTLDQHVEPHARLDGPASSEQHAVLITPGSTLHDLYGDRRMVNTLHHQAVARLGSGLRITARSDDGTIEGLEREGADIVAVQWHPELMSSRPEDPLFRWLVEKARTHMAS